MTAAKYKHASMIPDAGPQFSDPIRVGVNRRLHFSVKGTGTFQPQMQIRFNFDQVSDWRNLLFAGIAPPADLGFEDNSFRTSEPCEIRVGVSSYAAGSPVISARESGFRR